MQAVHASVTCAHLFPAQPFYLSGGMSSSLMQTRDKLAMRFRG